MKKFFLAVALIASVMTAGAQVKSLSAAKSALEKAEADAANVKKAAKVATWLKLAQSYMDAYNAPMGNGWIGGQAQELALVMGQKPSSEENVVVNGTQYLKQAYAAADYYFNENGQLAMIKVTKPIAQNALDKALEAYKNAFANDPKGSKTEDIVKGIESIGEKLTQEAYDAYTVGDLAGASALFEKVAAAVATEPCSKVDAESVYNAGFTAFAGENYERAKSLFEKCSALNYFGEDGDVYAKLATCLEKLGDVEGSKNMLEKGFEAYPQSQAILISLINYYTNSGEDTDKLFTLIDSAKKNEPNNASLYYVEGNIYKELGKDDEAIAAYRKCAEVDPTYAHGFAAEGLLLYNKAFDIQEEAQAELDDAKYMALVEKFDAALKGCIEPFEKAFETSTDDQFKGAVAEYLKNACYRYRDSDDAYKAKYEKYSAVLAQ